MGVHGTYGVRIHPPHLHIGKQLGKLLLDLLGPGANGLQGAAAVGAPGRNRLGVAAVVAHQPVVGTVVGHTDAAPGALRSLSAVHASKRPAVSPAVQKQNRLLPRFLCFQDFLPEGIAQRRIVSLAKLVRHVHDLHLGKGPPVEPAAQGI